jgi:arylsulfatase A-like enzyme
MRTIYKTKWSESRIVRPAGLAGLAGLALITGVPYGCKEDSKKEKPNIVILLADDMGWGDLHINSNKMVETPVLDGLAAQSMSLERFYVCPLSAPTRSEMLTGRYFLRTGVSSVSQGYENMRSDEVTIAEVLKKNGYSTGCFGKWHNGGYYKQHPLRKGFDEYTGFCNGHFGYYYDMEFVHNDTTIISSGYTTDFFTDMALDFIDRHKDGPFFCYVPYNVPHSPFQVPQQYFSKYNSTGLDSTLSCVYGMVDNMDENAGRILKKLEDLKLMDNTIIIFFSDNGPNTVRYNGGMKGIKGSVDEGGVRLPFYIKWENKIKPGKTEQLAQDIDILPTLLGLCGITYTPVKPLDGTDLSSVISGKRKPFDRYIFSRQANLLLKNNNSSVRNNKYRLVRTKTNTFLYDMMNDPTQKTDISGSEKEIYNEMSAVLNKWEGELVSNYSPVTTIEAGFAEEKSFTLPVQDAVLSDNVKFSSIYPNQAYTRGWSVKGDSVFWNLKIAEGGRYSVDLKYGCPEGHTGSEFLIRSGAGSFSFIIKTPFNSAVLPDRDYVKRGESVERTWKWMSIGELQLNPGDEKIVLKLVKPSANDELMVRAIRLTRQ